MLMLDIHRNFVALILVGVDSEIIEMAAWWLFFILILPFGLIIVIEAAHKRWKAHWQRTRALTPEAQAIVDRDKTVAEMKVAMQQWMSKMEERIRRTEYDIIETRENYRDLMQVVTDSKTEDVVWPHPTRLEQEFKDLHEEVQRLRRWHRWLPFK